MYIFFLHASVKITNFPGESLIKIVNNTYVKVSNIIGRYENLNIDKLTCLNVSRLKSWFQQLTVIQQKGPKMSFEKESNITNISSVKYFVKILFVYTYT